MLHFRVSLCPITRKKERVPVSEMLHAHSGNPHVSVSLFEHLVLVSYKWRMVTESWLALSMPSSFHSWLPPPRLTSCNPHVHTGYISLLWNMLRMKRLTRQRQAGCLTLYQKIQRISWNFSKQWSCSAINKKKSKGVDWNRFSDVTNFSTWQIGLQV